MKETNLEHSALDIQAGSGNVELRGNVGFSVSLSSFKVDTTGEVKIGGGKTSSGTVAGTAYTGQIRTDRDVDIKGGAVNIGDLIQSKNGNVSIMSAGDNGAINVNGIDANGKIKLVAEGDRAQISLNRAYNDGSLVSGSGDNDAVVIDLKGKNASFKNDTNQSNPAIITDTDGGWKIFKVNEKVNEVEPNVPDDDVMVKQKPDFDAHEPSNTSGTASYTSNLGGRQGVPGVDRVAGLTDAQLPFFRVEAGKVTQYGTYDVTETPSEVRLQPTGKRLPEPNQPKTQYREYTKTLTTADGSGQFLLTYDGSTFRIEPTDGAALALVRAGDAKHNVDLAAKALHVGFSEMGLVLESLDAVYVCLDGHGQTGSDELA